MIDLCMIGFFIGGIGLGLGVSAALHARKLAVALVVACEILRRRGYALTKFEYDLLKDALK